MKPILFVLVFLMFSMGVSAVTVTRQITGDEVTLTITNLDNQRFSGNFHETLPTNYEPIEIVDADTDLGSGLYGVKNNDVTHLLNLFILSTKSPAKITYRVSGSGLGTVSGTYTRVGDTVITATTTGDSGLNVGCTYATVCSELDSCGARPRDTDGTSCDTSKKCVSGTCTTVSQAECTQASDCDDSNTCTADVCSTENTCTHTNTCSSTTAETPRDNNTMIIVVIGGLFLFMMMFTMGRK